MTVPDFMPVLSKGSHNSPKSGACIMEYCSILAGEEFSDAPDCVDHRLRYVSIAINDFLSNENRHKIIPYINRLMNTADAGRSLNHSDEFVLNCYYNTTLSSVYGVYNAYVNREISSLELDETLISFLAVFTAQFEKMTKHTPITLTDNDYRMLKDAVGV